MSSLSGAIDGVQAQICRLTVQRRREFAGSKTLDSPRDAARSAFTQTVRRERMSAEEKRLARIIRLEQADVA